ncbi:MULTISPECIES: DUF4189 domain-containing protein [unclassified Xanthomonas]|uniref:DUF4189 domain-containing protein n=1 Tax=Xanthomonas sp. LMG 9002 TaxID=1591158 RepID=UPI0013693947|nr:DUF4189 domain-containing protein [Xanthomonas sp. LMG 9002]MXV07280.1 DUF4189 domain-containing protein [Xanthomonas sp. LMG 9002]
MNFKKVELAAGFFLLLNFGGTAFAQTRCPVGAQAGSAQCLPDDEASAPSRPAGEWIKTWGAIATSPSGNGGVSSGRFSKDEAQSVALQNCKNAGVKNCTVEFVYYNQCVALVYPPGGNGGIFYSAATVKEAVSLAKSKCETSAKAECKVAISECSRPVFKKY